MSERRRDPPPPPRRTPRRGATPPPVPKRSKAPVRGRTQAQTPEIVAAHKRMSAAKLCATSLYAALPSAGLLLFLGGAALIGSIAAIGTGIAGLIRLQAVGMGPPLTPDLKGIERVSVRMARRAKPQAGTGIAVGALVLCVFVFQFWAAQKEKERRRGHMDQWMERMRHLDDDGSDAMSPETERALEEALRERLREWKKERAAEKDGN